MPSVAPPLAYFPDPENPARWLCFDRPLAAWRADSPSEVEAAVARAESRARKGDFVAGLVCSEAAAALNPDLPARAPDSVLPLAWFAAFAAPRRVEAVAAPADGYVLGRIRPSISRSRHRAAVDSILAQIAAGQTYQVNFTFSLRARFCGSPRALMRDLAARQPSPNAAFLRADDWAVCSASPELFFHAENGIVSCRPMKGTRAPAANASAALAVSGKDRAENLMIVDMLRNDLSRLPDARAVAARELLQIESYPTVVQMVSTVRARSRAGLSDLLAALFPCASVTGAPKRAAMRIIAALERAPRGVYCGAIGILRGRRARFNVAIRTAVIDLSRGVLRYGVGGGIVADSRPADEWDEAMTKAQVLTGLPRARLIETMRAENGAIALLPRHIERVTQSARALDFVCDSRAIERAVRASARETSGAGGVGGARKIRLLLGSDGATEIHSMPLPKPSPKSPSVVRACFSRLRTQSDDSLLRHKTTRRALYEEAQRRARRRGFDDAVLRNERGEVTETCVGNIVAQLTRGGAWITPPLACGLLPGVARGAALAAGEMQTGVLTRRDLLSAHRVLRINALGATRLVFAARNAQKDGRLSRARRNVAKSAIRKK